MSLKVQDPAVQGRASRDPLSWAGSCEIYTPSDRQAQILAARFGLSNALARRVAWLCFGGGCHD